MEYEYIKGVPHHVFDTLDEMSEHFEGKPPKVYEDWHDAPEGAWVKSDDDRYIQLLKRKNTSPEANKYQAKYWVRTVVGTYTNTQKMDTDFSKHSDRYSFGGKSSGQGMVETLSSRKEISFRERAWVRLTLVYKDPFRAYDQVWPGIKNQEYLRQRVTVLLQQARIMAELHKCVATAAESLGINPKFVLENLKDVAKNKEEKGTARVNACKEIAYLLDLAPKKVDGKWAGELKGHISDAEVSEIEGSDRPMIEGSTGSD